MPGDTSHILVVFHILQVVKQAPGASDKEMSCYSVVVQQAVPQQKMDLVPVEI